MDVAQHAKVVLLIFKVSKRGKEAAGQIEASGPNEVPHVLRDPLDCSAGFGRMLARLRQQKWRAINARDFETALGEFYGVPSRPAAKIEHTASAALGQRKDPADLIRRGSESLVGKHKGIKIPPEIIIFKPFHGYRV